MISRTERFQVDFKTDVASPDHRRSETESHSSEGAGPRACRILVTEDDPVNQLPA